jgi:hypothetical protein
MPKRSSALVGALILGSVLGAVRAQAQPFGFIDFPAPGQQGLSGSVPVIGWVADASGVINHVDFLVDGRVVAGSVGSGLPSTALFGTPRPDVFAAFPNIPNSFNSGFVANIDTTAFIDGVHVITVRAFNGAGVANTLDARTVQIINNGSTLPPFGFMDFPLDKASILCNPPAAAIPPPPPPGGCPSPPVPPCIPGQPPPSPQPLSFYKNVVSGWALDVGSRLDKGQVSYVELLLDGNIIVNSHRDCARTSNFLVNCYGVNRPDVARAYSGYVNADNSGFFFAFALQQDPFNGLLDIIVPNSVLQPTLAGFTTSGKHTLAIRAGDEKETVTQIAVISVDVLCDLGSFGDQPAIGYIDVPTDLQFMKGVVTFSGWAFDFDNGGQASNINGVTRIDIDVDGQVVGTLFPPFRSRPDVPANDFRVPATLTDTGPTAFVGWAFTFDTGRLSDSQHDLVVYVVDTPNAVTGRPAFRTEIGRRKFVVFNNTPTKG